MKNDKKNINNEAVIKSCADNCFFMDDLGHIIRLALSGQTDEVRLFLARLVRKYRIERPEFAEMLNGYLRAASPVRNVLRREVVSPEAPTIIPHDEDTRLSLLKPFLESPSDLTPLFSPSLQNKLNHLILERKSVAKLQRKGLFPLRSAIFTGPPGVGKTLAARWIAAQLDVPLYVLDLTTVMSSLLGKTGANLRAVLDFARSTPCVLFLDEIDSIAKKRSDNADVGELKRLVTIMLQEIENWSEDSLLLAATNFPELLDPAIWRRFDAIVDFPLPEATEIERAIDLYSGNDKKLIDKWRPILLLAFKNRSYSDIEKVVKQIRRINALDPTQLSESINEQVHLATTGLDKKKKKELILLLSTKGLSNRAIAEATGTHRDTVAKYLAEEKKMGTGGE